MADLEGGRGHTGHDPSQIFFIYFSLYAIFVFLRNAGYRVNAERRIFYNFKFFKSYSAYPVVSRCSKFRNESANVITLMR